MLSIIVAIANNNVIGKDNKLVWHVPEDLKRFKEITMNKTIIMGRKTFESLGRVLPNRKHVILSKDFEYDDPSVEVVNDVNTLQEYIDSDEEVFVIGGESVYKLLLPYTKKLYITNIKHDFEGDTFFPEVDFNEWEVVSHEKGADEVYGLEYVTYSRKP